MGKTNSYLKELYCPKCSKVYDADKIQHLCECGSPLLVRYDLEKAKKELSKDILAGRENSLWRYKELLPVTDDENIVSLGEGMTPVIPLRALGEKIGLNNLYLKDEGIIPTGTFKARGAAVGISKAKELGVDTIAMPTNGNAGAAWSVYGARAGIRSVIVMPEDAAKITRNECAAAGADLYLVKGLISDAGKIVASSIQKNGWYDASTLKEPYRIEGKKTMGLEIAEQFSWEVPDAILYPTGGGVGIIGIYKALKELQAIGWIGDKLPKLISVQAEGCAPIVKAFEEKKDSSEFFENSETVAFGINVPKALGDFLVLKAIYDTNGAAVSVSDEEIIDSVSLLAKTEGVFACPEGASLVAAVKKLQKSGVLKADDKVVLLNTGAGIKYPDTLTVDNKYAELNSTL
ncbi:MAG: threonine synthase [Lachnospiraceae bacterium]|nr:threonine synthase [Lachnospiraceae bacterium]MBP5565147.1 threonine synthase [Lachnospiraceae bacterium]